MVKMTKKSWQSSRTPLRYTGSGEVVEKGRYWSCGICGKEWKLKSLAKACEWHHKQGFSMTWWKR